MDEELRSHVQHRADDLVEHSGLSRAEAERRARIELGSHEKVKEECREALATYFLETFLQDIDFGVRMLRKSPRFSAAFAGVALFLSLLGLYALLAYWVKQRTAEIGMRMALGAQRSHVLRMVIRQGLLLAGAGIIVGSAVSLALTRLLRGLLFDVAPNDPETLLVVTLLLIVVALAASLIPAWRATRIDPMAALRHE